MSAPRSNRTPGSGSRRRAAALVSLVALALCASACGSRLTGHEALLAQGAGTSHSTGGSSGTSAGTAEALGSTDATTTTIASASPGVGGGTTGAATSHTVTTVAPATASSSASNVAAAGTSPTAPCGANGNLTPAGGNGGATAPGVTATTITVGNIASISGVVPGLTQSAQQATEAWAAYVNSTGGICGRQVKVQPFDDGSDSGTNYADSQQACSSDFAMVGNASGFDDGSAQAVGACGIPDMSAEVSTVAAGTTADIFGASPGNAHYWSLGPANYLKSQYPTAIQHAAMIYLNVSATQTQSEHEVAA
jgi:ABC-type branched-subunit amino acid transport system substrate-binding protein